MSEAVWRVFRLGSGSAQHVLIRTCNFHSLSCTHGLFFTGGKSQCPLNFCLHLFPMLSFGVFFSVILNTPIGWQVFQNFCKYCWCILKDVLRGCVEGMNGMTGICVSLTLHHLLPLGYYRKILSKNFHPKWNVKACKAQWSYSWHGEEKHVHSKMIEFALCFVVVFAYADQRSREGFFPANCKKKSD